MKKRCLFLDRDNVLNHDKGYTYKVEDLSVIEANIEIIKSIKDSFDIIVICTNQSGIAKRLYSEADMHRFNNALLEELLGHNISIDKIYFAPYSSESNHWLRKPNPGMLEQADMDFGIDKENSLFIGDSMTDREAAERFNIKFLKV